MGQGGPTASAVAWGVLAALLALAAIPADAASLPGNRFPVIQRTLFLSGSTGDAAGQDEVLLLQPGDPGPQGRQDFLAPGVDALGLVRTPSTQSWYTQSVWEKDLEIVDDAVARLHFLANPQGLAVFHVRLYDVSPDGQADLIASDQQQFVTLLGQPIQFELHTTGAIVHKGHVLRLDVIAETANALVVLQYGGDTPSALDHLLTRWLDSDGDGVADSDELNLNRNPLNPNDPTDEGRDRDGDGLVDRVEANIGTSPTRGDSDGDGYGDGLEVHAGTNPRDARSVPYDVNQNGLPDVFETTYFGNATFNNSTLVTPTTGPCTPGPNCVDPFGDPDGDGCNNLCEAAHGTNPTNPDTDGDGIPDGQEIAAGTDPKSFLSTVVESPMGIPEPVATAAFFALGTSLCLIPLLRRH